MTSGIRNNTGAPLPPLVGAREAAAASPAQALFNSARVTSMSEARRCSVGKFTCELAERVLPPELAAQAAAHFEDLALRSLGDELRLAGHAPFSPGRESP